MRPLTLSAIIGAAWLVGVLAALMLVARFGASAAVLAACAGIGAACVLGTLAMGWIVEHAVRRQSRLASDDLDLLAGVFAGLPVPAAILGNAEEPVAATRHWPEAAEGIDPARLAEPGRHALGTYNAYVTPLAGGERLVTLMRAGAVIPATALERFAAAVLANDRAFRFDAAAVAATPALAVFNHILAAPGRLAFTDSQSGPEQTAALETGVAIMQMGEQQGVQNALGASEGSAVSLSDRDFARIRARVQAIAGISLSEAKRTLVISRLSKLVRARGFKSFSAYLDHLERSGSADDEQAFVNALTTNLTRFFREDHHFEHLRHHVAQMIAQPPRLAPNGKPRLRIWSAGCSTGQEPYTIALSLLEAFPELARWDFRILATDIDTNVLTCAAQGIYPASELDGLSAERVRLFETGPDGSVRIPARARGLITFNRLNLMASPWPFRGPFDAIFCRNVAIYFDKPTQGKLFDRLGEVLAPDGFLYIGHSENLSAVSKEFKMVGKTVYQLKTVSSQRDAA